jgi:hypothetical protein
VTRTLLIVFLLVTAVILGLAALTVKRAWPMLKQTSLNDIGDVELVIGKAWE